MSDGTSAHTVQIIQMHRKVRWYKCTHSSDNTSAQTGQMAQVNLLRVTAH